MKVNTASFLFSSFLYAWTYTLSLLLVIDRPGENNFHNDLFNIIFDYVSE